MIGTSEVTSVFSSSIVSLAKAMSKSPKKRNLAVIISLITLLISTTISIINKSPNDIIFIVAVFFAFLSGLIFLSGLLSYVVKDVKTVSEKMQEINTERERLVQRTEEKGNILDIIRLNLNQLDEYYTINKVQAKNSYSFSVITIVFGFLAIIFGVAYLIYKNEFSEIVIITSLSGLLMEFIGATSLVLYKESTKSIAEFYNKLSYLQHVMLAVELSEKLSADKKDKEISNIISSLVLRKPEKQDIG